VNRPSTKHRSQFVPRQRRRSESWAVYGYGAVPPDDIDEFFRPDPLGHPERQRDLSRLLEPEQAALVRALPVIISAVLALATLLGIALLRPTGEERPDLAAIGVNPTVYGAVVETVEIAPCTGTTEADNMPCSFVDFRLEQGPDVGEVVVLAIPAAETSPTFAVGEHVVLDHRPDAEPAFRYSYYDRQRRPILLAVALLFAIVVVVLGRLRGFAALIGLGITVVVLLQFVVPAIIDGRSPVLVAIVGASAVSYVGLYLAHGFNKMATVALLGTLAALALTTVLSWIALGIAQLSGFASDESYIITMVGRIDISGLILAGVVLGTVGAVDDVTVTQASAVWELQRARPGMSHLELFRAGLRVGRDHVASMVNTLLLAYAGASMPLLIFFVLSNQSLGTVMNSEVVATEVLRTLIGSIGVVAAVPLTTWLAAATAIDVPGSKAVVAAS